jgi:hypothetical protein
MSHLRDDIERHHGRRALDSVHYAEYLVDVSRAERAGPLRLKQYVIKPFKQRSALEEIKFQHGIIVEFVAHNIFNSNTEKSNHKSYQRNYNTFGAGLHRHPPMRENAAASRPFTGRIKTVQPPAINPIPSRVCCARCWGNV